MSWVQNVSTSILKMASMAGNVVFGEAAQGGNFSSLLFNGHEKTADLSSLPIICRVYLTSSEIKASFPAGVVD